MRRPRPLDNPGLYTLSGLLSNAKGSATRGAAVEEGESKSNVPSCTSGGVTPPQLHPTLSSTLPSQTVAWTRVVGERQRQSGTDHSHTSGEGDGLIDSSNRSFNSSHAFLTNATSCEQEGNVQTPVSQDLSSYEDSTVARAPLPLLSNVARNRYSAHGTQLAWQRQCEHWANVSVLAVHDDAAKQLLATVYQPPKEEKNWALFSASSNEGYSRSLNNPAPREAGGAAALIPSTPPEPTTPAEPVGSARYVRPCGPNSPTPHVRGAGGVPSPQPPDAAVTQHRYRRPNHTSLTDGGSTGFHHNASDRCVLSQRRVIRCQPPCSPLDATLAPHERLLHRGAPGVPSTATPIPGTLHPVHAPAGHTSLHSSPLTLKGEEGIAASVENSVETQHTVTLAALHSPTGGPMCSSDSIVFSYAETKAPADAGTPASAWIKDGLYAAQQSVSTTSFPSAHASALSFPAGAASSAATTTTSSVMTALASDTPPTQPLSCVALPKMSEHHHHHASTITTTTRASSPGASPAVTPITTVSMTTKTTTTVTAGGGAFAPASVTTTNDREKHCRVLPVLPSRLQDGLVQLYSTDARQASAATSVLEAVQRTNKVRGRRPPSSQTFGLQGSSGAGGGDHGMSTGELSMPHLGPFCPPPSPTVILLPTTLPPNPVPAGTRVFSRPLMSGSSMSDNSLHHRSPRQAMLVKSTTTTKVTTTTGSTLPGESTDFIHSAVSNPGLSVSNTITNRHVSLAEDTSASSLVLRPRVLSLAWFRGSETGFDPPSLLSLVDIGLNPDTPSPHRPEHSLTTVEERSAARLPLELQHLPAGVLAARSTSSSYRRLGSGGTRAEAEVHPPAVFVKALSHMECAAQPKPNLVREDASFYRQTLLDVAKKMAELPSPQHSTEAAESSLTGQPSLKVPHEERSGDSD